jgi:sugar lactone lactonase YvrE
MSFLNIFTLCGPKRHPLYLSGPSEIAEVVLMKIHKSMLIKGLAFAYLIWTMCLLTGCRSAEVEQPVSGPIFFPPPPELPRLQFLTSFSEPEDFDARTVGGLERFVIGEPEAMQGITLPHGMALFEGKLYVCDVGRKMVSVFNLRNRTFSYLTKDQRFMKPVNIFIDNNGWKYVADSKAGLVFVFDHEDNLLTMLGQQLKINPIDVAVRGDLCYVTDYNSNKVVVLNKVTGQEIMSIGLKRSLKLRIQPEPELPPGEISLISDLALDEQGNIYVTDKAGGRITQFNPSGIFMRTIGRLGDNIDEFVRPKGIAIDRENRIWVVDAATEVAKIYNEQGKLLLFFGLPGNKPGMMNLPATIILDYDNVKFFQKYAVQGAKIEFLVLVTNQYGPNKISVYGFGTFPVHGKANK